MDPRRSGMRWTREKPPQEMWRGASKYRTDGNAPLRNPPQLDGEPADAGVPLDWVGFRAAVRSLPLRGLGQLRNGVQLVRGACPTVVESAAEPAGTALQRSVRSGQTITTCVCFDQARRLISLTRHTRARQVVLTADAERESVASSPGRAGGRRRDARRGWFRRPARTQHLLSTFPIRRAESA